MAILFVAEQLQEFVANEPTLSDWNDKVAAVGIDEARVQFRRAMQMAERQQQDGRGR